jgi:hypothetical protein
MVPIGLFAILTPMIRPAKDPYDKAMALRQFAALSGCDHGGLESPCDALEPAPSPRRDTAECIEPGFTGGETRGWPLRWWPIR